MWPDRVSNLGPMALESDMLPTAPGNKRIKVSSAAVFVWRFKCKCFLSFSSGNRAPHKRQVKPVQKHLIQTNFGGDDSENDSDYHVESNGRYCCKGLSIDK